MATSPDDRGADHGGADHGDADHGDADHGGADHGDEAQAETSEGDEVSVPYSLVVEREVMADGRRVTFYRAATS